MKRTWALSGAIALACAAPLLGGWGKKPPVDKIWIIVSPVQCLGNLWEKDWLAAHNNKGWKYPRAKESTIVKSFFKKKGIQILEIRVKPYEKDKALCEACNCARGDTLFFLIPADDTPKMARLGYTERLPDTPDPSSKHASH